MWYKMSNFNSNLTIVIGKDNKKEILIDHRNDAFLQYAKNCGYAKDYGRLINTTGKPPTSQQLVVNDLLLTFKYCNVTYLPPITYNKSLNKDQSKTFDEKGGRQTESQGIPPPDDISVHQYSRHVVPQYTCNNLSKRENSDEHASFDNDLSSDLSSIPDGTDQTATRCCSNWSTSNNCSCSLSSETSFIFKHTTKDDCNECEKEIFPELRTPSIDDEVFFSHPVTPITNHRNSNDFLLYSKFGEVERKNSNSSTGRCSYGSKSRMFVSGSESEEFDENSSEKTLSSPVVLQSPTKNPPDRTKRCTDDLDGINSKRCQSSPVVLRHPTKNRSDRTKRCASIGAYIDSDGDEEDARKLRTRVSMYELGDKGWIYDRMMMNAKDYGKNRLNLDSDVEDIHKTKKAAVVSLGSIKVIF